ncbi:TIGR03086 family metal-binding protein [Actinomadura sp. 6K520]|uniref:TIGR03086 family metal-binding protein n=1 Tax=Actinomadura sp. 6K520 TaxID=2530364 RepID=UPI00104B7F73|nr:TIGR03086 family metal-binding protein [Actinomadura sp. 6K520]TDE18996.1 TIGR03086 family protein [Actinomadura sp. 6K520]
MFTIYERSLADVSRVVGEVGPGALSRPTPCGGWNLRQLLTHMVGQNDGFARAVADGEAPASASERDELADTEVQSEWERSAQALRGEFRAADLEREVRIEGFPPLPAKTALRMVALDNAVHAWDVASALGVEYRPGAELTAFCLEFAREIAALPREFVADSFGPPVAGTPAATPWAEALRLLGRSTTPDGRWPAA